MSGLVIWIKKKLELLLKYYRPLYAWGYDFLPKCSSSHLWLPLPKLWRSKFCKQSRSTGTHVWSRAVFDLRVENAVDRPKESLEAYSPYPPPRTPNCFAIALRVSQGTQPEGCTFCPRRQKYILTPWLDPQEMNIAMFSSRTINYKCWVCYLIAFTWKP